MLTRVSLSIALGCAATAAGCGDNLAQPRDASPAIDAGMPDTDASNRACDSCHGENGRSSPPKDTTGHVLTSERGVGAHAAHMTQSTWHAQLGCTECHAVPTSVNEPGHIDSPLPAEVTWGPLAGPSGVWNGTSCSNTYCHALSGLGAPGGTTPSPVWTQVDGTQSQCGTCHGNPPPPPHPVDADCGECHPSMLRNSGLVIAYPALHIDGKVDVTSDQACDSCHGSNGNAAPPMDTTGGTTTDLRGVGAHRSHGASVWRRDIECSDCHKVPSSLYAVGHIDTTLPAEITFSPLAGNATWNGSTCSNTYCHGTTLGGGILKNPVWTTVDGAVGQCGSCHGTPPPPPHPVDDDCGTCHDTMVAGGGLVIVDRTRHIDGNLDVDTNLACNFCHGSAASDAPPVDTVGNTATTARGVGAHQAHLATTNRFRPVACSDCHRVPTSVNTLGHIDTALPAELTFSVRAGSATVWAGFRCSNNYCHGVGLTGGTATAPLWTLVDGTQAECGACHGAPPPPPHPVNADCGVCHDTMTPGAGLVIADPQRHVDGNLDVVP